MEYVKKDSPMINILKRLELLKIDDNERKDLISDIEQFAMSFKENESLFSENTLIASNIVNNSSSIQTINLRESRLIADNKTLTPVLSNHEVTSFIQAAIQD